MLKRLYIRKQFTLLLLLSFLTGASLSAAETRFPEKRLGKSLGKPNNPLSITSDKMVFQNLKDKIIFEGTVVIQQEGLLLESDRAEIFLVRATESSSLESSSPRDENKAQQVSKVIASGKVRIKKGVQQAKAEKGVFDRMKAKIILSGNPELWEEGYRIKGKEITFLMDEERTLVTESEVVIQNADGGLNLRTR